MNGVFNKVFQHHQWLSKIAVILLLAIIILLGLFLSNLQGQNQEFSGQINQLIDQKMNLKKQLVSLEEELKDLKNEDQYLRNEKLQDDIVKIENTYTQAVKTYENLLSLKEKAKKTEDEDKLFAQALNQLAQRNYASAAATLTSLDEQIVQEEEKITAAFQIPESVLADNTPPGSGYRRQKVTIEAGAFMVSLVAADLNSTRVIVDTAAESDCHNDCPVLPLASFVARNGAFAGINGSYFCPASYPSCAGKTNTFEFLLMNKNKVYFNSDKNVYSTIPAAIFYGNTARFVTQSLEWGRDTSVDAVIANYPLLLLNGQIMYSGSDDPKLTARGNRSFIGIIGNTVYIGVVHNATVAQSGQVVKALGLNHALNLDNGGSTALWSGGYQVGPGRNLPNAVLLVKK